MSHFNVISRNFLPFNFISKRSTPEFFSFQNRQARWQTGATHPPLKYGVWRPEKKKKNDKKVKMKGGTRLDKRIERARATHELARL